MDSLVATLPEDETVEDWRFHLNRDGRTLTADDFDAWMDERNVHVASDGTIRRNGAAVETSAPAGVHLAVKPSRVVTAPAPSPAHGSVILQVASFAARDNADRALATLRGAGIDGANLHDGTANGRRIWRLRVGPLEDAAANGLASRIAGLGFDTPHRVTE